MESKERKEREKRIEDSKEIVAYYTLAASVTGAIPVPAASAAIVAENGVMISHIASVMGQKIDVGMVVKSIGLCGTLNLIGKQLFIEGAKLLSWGSGNGWATFGLSALGATTAGVQTYIIGRIAIEIAKNKGASLESETVSSIIKNCKATYGDKIKEWKKNKPRRPENLGAAAAGCVA